MSTANCHRIYLLLIFTYSFFVHANAPYEINIQDYYTSSAATNCGAVPHVFAAATAGLCSPAVTSTATAATLSVAWEMPACLIMATPYVAVGAGCICGIAALVQWIRLKRHVTHNTAATVHSSTSACHGTCSSPPPHHEPNDNKKKNNHHKRSKHKKKSCTCDRKERKFNIVSKQDFFKRVKHDYEHFKNGIYKKKSEAKGLAQDAEYLVWDALHGDVEAYNASKKHIGSYDPVTLKLYKPPVMFRYIGF